MNSQTNIIFHCSFGGEVYLKAKQEVSHFVVVVIVEGQS